MKFYLTAKQQNVTLDNFHTISQTSMCQRANQRATPMPVKTKTKIIMAERYITPYFLKRVLP